MPPREPFKQDMGKKNKATQEIDEFKKKRREIMVRGLLISMMDTYGWLMKLEERGILEDEDIREYASNLMEVNEILRHRKAMEYIPSTELSSIAKRFEDDKGRIKE